MPIGETLSLTSWNIGFGAYTDDYSFFMDGGKYSRAFSESAVVENLTAIGQELADFDTDFSLIQEVDIAATRSYQVDERAMLVRSLDADHTKYWTFAVNYDSPYLFYPILEPHGASKAGPVSYTHLDVYKRQGLSGARHYHVLACAHTLIRRIHGNCLTSPAPFFCDTKNDKTSCIMCP